MGSLDELVDATARAESFSGVVRVDRRGTTEVSKAYGYADRAYGIANTLETLFGTASAAKTFTALTVMALVEQGGLSLSTTARSLLGDDLPTIAEDVTVEQLLAHRSGIGDYFNEDDLDDITQYAISVPVHQLDHSRGLPQSAGRPPDGLPRRRELRLQQRRLRRAGPARRTRERCRLPRAGAPLRSRACRHGRHRLPAVGRAARIEPRAGTWPSTGCGPTCCICPSSEWATAAYTPPRPTCTACGRRCIPGGSSPRTRWADVDPRSDWPEESRRYGLGFHLHETGDAAWLEGYDAGVSFTSLHEPNQEVTYTVISNWTDGAWPIIELLNNQLGL